MIEKEAVVINSDNNSSGQNMLIRPCVNCGNFVVPNVVRCMINPVQSKLLRRELSWPVSGHCSGINMGG